MDYGNDIDQDESYPNLHASVNSSAIDVNDIKNLNLMTPDLKTPSEQAFATESNPSHSSPRSGLDAPLMNDSQEISSILSPTDLTKDKSDKKVSVLVGFGRNKFGRFSLLAVIDDGSGEIRH
jgi:hypothetical protein